jgi:hypothetical protein
MRASWGLDQSSVPDEPHAANPSGRSSYQIKCDARDTSIPDGESVADAAFDMEMSKLRKYADDKELNLTHIFKVVPCPACGTMHSWFLHRPCG